jgi:hypothetical protein
MTSKAKVTCKCGIEAKKLQCKKDNENLGRFFYACPKKIQIEQCKFFQWQDSKADPSDVRCKCEKYVSKRQCKKGNDNFGRYFYSCSECDHFSWAKETLDETEKRMHDMHRNVLNMVCIEPVEYPQSAEQVTKILKECDGSRIFYPDSDANRHCTEPKYLLE